MSAVDIAERRMHSISVDAPEARATRRASIPGNDHLLRTRPVDNGRIANIIDDQSGCEPALSSGLGTRTREDGGEFQASRCEAIPLASASLLSEASTLAGHRLSKRYYSYQRTFARYH